MSCGGVRARAVRAAEQLTGCLVAVADHGAAAVRAPRRQCVDRALERVEHVCLPVSNDLQRPRRHCAAHHAGGLVRRSARGATSRGHLRPPLPAPSRARAAAARWEAVPTQAAVPVEPAPRVAHVRPWGRRSSGAGGPFHPRQRWMPVSSGLSSWSPCRYPAQDALKRQRERPSATRGRVNASSPSWVPPRSVHHDPPEPLTSRAFRRERRGE